MKHTIPDEFRTRPILVDLVGVGGTGSRILPQLAELHVALRCFDHPGLKVYAFDPDLITEANIGRTAFAPSDIGNYKVAALIDRVNRTYGLMWRSIPDRYQWPLWRTEWQGARPDLVITCTDSLRSRAELHQQFLSAPREQARYWLDCGNGETTGQVVLGEPEWLGDICEFDRKPRLHTIVDLFPEMLENASNEEPDPDSCTLAVALGRQSLTINRWMATAAFELLWQLFRRGGLDHNVVWVNAQGIRTNPEYRATPAGGVVVEAPPIELAASVERRPRRRRLRSTGRVCPGRHLEQHR